MKYDAVLDISTSKSAVGVLNRQDGAVVLETTVQTDATAILAALKPCVGRLHLVGHEAGGLSPWLHRELQALGLPIVLLQTRHAAAALKAQRNKTDKNEDALGLDPAGSFGLVPRRRGCRRVHHF